MKTLLKKYFTTNQGKNFTAFLLTGILSFSSGLTLITNSPLAAANPLSETTKEVLKQNRRTNRLPSSVANAVLRDVAQKQGISPKKLRIIDYSQQTWANGCLELPQPDELCTEALVPGWLVVVSDDQQNWTYHTNNNGRLLRLAGSNTPTNNLPSSLPESVKNAVLRLASARLQQPISQLTIIQAQQQTWRDGCLELADSNQVCTAVLVPGWRVVVGKAHKNLVYHTNDTGTVVRLNEKASGITTNTIKPVQIPPNELPQPLDQGVVFREISSGGFTGRIYQTILLNDGTLVRVRIGDANDSERSVRRISVQQVKQFERFLNRADFSRFKNLSYPAPNGSADYITYTLTSPEGTVQYNDIAQNKLPKNLRSIIKAWNKISKN